MTTFMFRFQPDLEERIQWQPSSIQIKFIKGDLNVTVVGYFHPGVEDYLRNIKGRDVSLDIAMYGIKDELAQVTAIRSEFNVGSLIILKCRFKVKHNSFPAIDQQLKKCLTRSL